MVLRTWNLTTYNIHHSDRWRLARKGTDGGKRGLISPFVGSHTKKRQKKQKTDKNGKITFLSTDLPPPLSLSLSVSGERRVSIP